MYDIVEDMQVVRTTQQLFGKLLYLPLRQSPLPRCVVLAKVVSESAVAEDFLHDDIESVVMKYLVNLNDIGMLNHR